MSETFGLIMIESMACGTPVAALPSDASKVVIDHKKTGFVGNLVEGIEYCIENVDSETCIKYSEQYRWANATEKFFNNLIRA